MDDFNEPQSEILNDPPNPLRNLFKEVWQTVLLSLLIFAAINFATVRIRIQSISMQPTLFERDFVLVNKLAYSSASFTAGM
jgi:signal peptidase I